MTIRVPNLFAHAAGAFRRWQNSSLKYPSETFLDAVFGPMSTSGARVTPETALGVATVFACVSLLSRVMSTLPLKLYERKGDTREELSSHPVALLLGVRPNPEQTPADVRGALMANLAMRGNAYAVIVRDRAGRPAELWPVQSGQVQPYRDGSDMLHYRVIKDGKSQDILFANMLHIRGLTFDGSVGHGAGMARECIGLAIALEDNASSFFGNQSRPGLLLETAAPLKEDQIKLIYDYLKKYHEGPTNAYRTLILNGCKVASARNTNEQAQFDETRNRQAVEVCKLFGVPPHKVGILDKATFSNIEQQQIQFVVDTIGPLCVQWEQAMAGALLTDVERRRLFLRHNLNALQRGDFQTRVNGYVQMIQNGVLSPNEVRALEEMDPREGGDVYLTPLNMSQGGKDNAPPPGKPPANRMNGHKTENDPELLMS
jgi:HK97 family phage portal protein